jgi:hypothetical protein
MRCKIARPSFFSVKNSPLPFFHLFNNLLLWTELMLFGSNFAPRGWLFCDGSLQLIGTTYGGDGHPLQKSVSG